MKLLRFFLPRIEYILLGAIFWGVVASGPRILNFDGDLPRHILTGNLILQTGQVPTTDLFSFRTIGHPSIPHEWFSQVLLAALYNWLDLDGIVLMTGIVLLLVWGIVYRLSMRKSNSFFAALLIVALAVAASQIHVLPRPHIFTFLFIPIWIMLLESIRENNLRSAWFLPILMLIWVNMHGMFVLGLIILGIYIIGDFLDHPSTSWFRGKEKKSLLIAGGLSLIATLFSPSGFKIWDAIISLGSNAYITSKIPEYQSPNFHIPETWPFIVILLITILGFARSTEKTSWIDILLVVSLTGLALYSSRMIPLFAIATAPITAKTIADWIRGEFSKSRLLIIQENILKINSTANGIIWFFVIILMTAMILRSGQSIDPDGRRNVFDQRFFPVGAVNWLETHPQSGQMFNAFDWGGYLLLRLWPDQQIFMDGHTHIYGETLTRDYEQVIALQAGWQEIFERYRITWVIVPTNWKLVDELVAQGWEAVYEDQTAIILTEK